MSNGGGGSSSSPHTHTLNVAKRQFSAVVVVVAPAMVIRHADRVSLASDYAQTQTRTFIAFSPFACKADD